ncbi:MAG: hypothetical protein JXQ83_03835, partial [Candidatus Glassbacteria bacterium]|nr:hypothetical protein [Candidatus Glassbacteria bacterium]
MSYRRLLSLSLALGLFFLLQPADLLQAQGAALDPALSSAPALDPGTGEVAPGELPLAPSESSPYVEGDMDDDGVPDDQDGCPNDPGP